MIENSLEQFSDVVYRFLTGKAKGGKNMLVKRHSLNLQTHGDFSFPNTLKSWHGHVPIIEENNEVSLLKHLEKSKEDIIEESQQWPLQIIRLKEEKDRIHLFLDRPKAIVLGLRESSKNIILILENLTRNCTQVYCDEKCERSEDLTSLRVKYLMNVVKNLCEVCGNNTENTASIIVTSNSSSKGPEDNRIILCGTVLNARTGVKETVIDGNEYIRIRQNEMTLVAQHKYGVRVNSDLKWKEFLDHLGESAVAFELLQIKPSSAVKINFDCPSSGSSKGAAFVLYNCARLETMLRTFNEKVEEGTYPPLPPFEDIDFSLLSQEEEWTLIFNYIMGLPSLLSNCVDMSQGNCDFRPHHICGFLSSLVRVFSQYYRKTRILTEPRKHLLPLIFARLHMLKILNETLKLCLKVLNIKSVSQMWILVFIFYWPCYLNSRQMF